MKSTTGFTSRLLLLALLGVVPSALADDLSPELRQQVDAAVSDGLDWLAAQQSEKGSWSNHNFPALTAMPLDAFIHSRHKDREAIIDKGCAFLMSNVQDDGGIYRKSLLPGRGGLSTYNTAVCMTTLYATGREAFLPTVLNARKFVAASQLTGDDEHAGGFGYNQTSMRRSTDLMVTLHAVEAMTLTQGAEDSRNTTESRVSLDADAIHAYIARMQNKAGAGEADEGGFFYGPGKSGAGKTTNAEGEVVFRSYGSMTYAGLLALIYADVPRDDARVKSAFDWSVSHWTLDENPGLGQQGMYFFYNVLSKALDAYGVNPIVQKEGDPINWKQALAEKLLSQLQTDAESAQRYWVNENGRYWENDPILVTAYAIQALQRL